MRRIVVLVLATLFLLGSAIPGAAQLLTIGLKGGPTFANVDVSASDFPEVGRRTGTVVGVSLGFGGGSFGVRPEVLLVQKGFVASEGADEAVFKVDYVEIPLLLVARFGSGTLRPAIYGGPAIGVERSCTIDGDFPDFTATGDCDAPSVDQDRETVDVGAAFGAELGIRLGGLNLIADARYTLGLTNLDPEASGDIKNRVFSLTGGIEIPIG